MYESTSFSDVSVALAKPFTDNSANDPIEYTHALLIRDIDCEKERKTQDQVPRIDRGEVKTAQTSNLVIDCTPDWNKIARLCGKAHFSQ